MRQELDRMLLVATAFIPNETLRLGEVIGAKPVDAIRERRTIAQAPSWFARRRPGVAQVHLAVEVRFVDVNQPQLLLTNLAEQLLKLGHEGSALVRFCFREHLLTLFPTQPFLLEEGAQRTPAHI